MNVASVARPPLPRLSHEPRLALRRDPAPAPSPRPPPEAAGIRQPLTTMGLRAEKPRKGAERCAKIISAAPAGTLVPSQPSPVQTTAN